MQCSIKFVLASRAFYMLSPSALLITIASAISMIPRLIPVFVSTSNFQQQKKIDHVVYCCFT
jgi:hypothetical protein